MGSDVIHKARHAQLARRSRDFRAGIGVAGLVLAAAGAAAGHWLDSPRVLVLCGLALCRLALPTPVQEVEPGFGLPTDLQAAQHALLRAEAMLEHAPVALWRRSAGRLQPANAAARRLMAPGRVVSTGQIDALLQAATPGKRALVAFDSERGLERAVLAAIDLTIAGQPERLLALMPIESELEAEALVAASCQARGGAARFTVESPMLELLADPGQLEQALLNLIKNAADATAQVDAPQVDVTARLARGGRLVIEVADNGPGVPAGMEDCIFTPFFSTKDKGLGVGLALVRNLVHGMGGTVRYAKRASGGACFVLVF
jgi:signal transduction histidine kinase